MLIPVVFENGRRAMVKAYLLDRLIEEKRIISFQRSSGWVVLGHDPIRTCRRVVYCIPDRRESAFVLNG
jgi:hypothetical protein